MSEPQDVRRLLARCTEEVAKEYLMARGEMLAVVKSTTHAFTAPEAQEVAMWSRVVKQKIAKASQRWLKARSAVIKANEESRIIL